MNREELYTSALNLLQELIKIPSLSREENGTATLLEHFLSEQNIEHFRVGNNVYALSKGYDPSKPTLFLNSHHDTVMPSPAYTQNPFEPITTNEKLFGLGSNDAGVSLVCLIHTFLYFQSKPLHCNLIIAATAEEEISGKGGLELLLKDEAFLQKIGGKESYQNFTGIVGEPTKMQMAIAERGLMVLDCEATGKTGHAAREEGENAVYIALDDIHILRNSLLDKNSDLLGMSKITATHISTENTQHNVVPASCKFLLDVRLNEHYTHEQALDLIRSNLRSACIPRSMRIRSSIIPIHHPLVQAGTALGLQHYGSPTTSDKALMPFPALKMGPGDSARSHMADEFIFLTDIDDGIEGYINIITKTYA